MGALRRGLEGMRAEMQALEDELFATREERAAVELERAAAADEADGAAADLAAAERRQAELVAALDEVSRSSVMRALVHDAAGHGRSMAFKSCVLGSVASTHAFTAAVSPWSVELPVKLSRDGRTRGRCSA